MTEGNRVEPNTELCKRMLSPYNIEKAIQNVKRNGGSGGIDGVQMKRHRCIHQGKLDTD